MVPQGAQKKRTVAVMLSSSVAILAVGIGTFFLVSSNTQEEPVSVEREPWAVGVYKSYPTSDPKEMYLGVTIASGTGDFSTYLVEDATGEVIADWDSSSSGSTRVDNRGHDDIDWVTAYVAEPYKEGTSVSPSHVDDLHNVIATNRGVNDVHSGLDK
jgi:hypothetical protein